MFNNLSYLTLVVLAGFVALQPLLTVNVNAFEFNFETLKNVFSMGSKKSGSAEEDSARFYFESISSASLGTWLNNLHKVTKEELSLIERGSGVLTAYEARPSDCYKEAASALRKGCREVHLDESEKIKYAVRLTKCEIATANIQPPMECQDDGGAIAVCVEAISKIPQLWTSYSGYFRDVVSMCFAVHYEIERDLLESLFHNLTYTQLLNSQILKHHTSNLISLQNLSSNYFKSLLLTTNAINSSTSFLTANMTTLSKKVTRIGTYVIDQVHEIAEISKRQKAVHDTLNTVIETASELKREVSRTKQGFNNMRNEVGIAGQELVELQNKVTEWVGEVEIGLRTLKGRTENASEAFLNALMRLEEAIGQSQERILEDMNRRGTLLVMMEMQTQSFIQHHQKSFANLSQTSKELSKILSQIYHHSFKISETLQTTIAQQNNLSESMVVLEQTIQNTFDTFSKMPVLSWTASFLSFVGTIDRPGSFVCLFSMLLAFLVSFQMKKSPSVFSIRKIVWSLLTVEFAICFWIGLGGISWYLAAVNVSMYALLKVLALFPINLAEPSSLRKPQSNRSHDSPQSYFSGESMTNITQQYMDKPQMQALDVPSWFVNEVRGLRREVMDEVQRMREITGDGTRARGNMLIAIPNVAADEENVLRPEMGGIGNGCSNKRGARPKGLRRSTRGN